VEGLALCLGYVGVQLSTEFLNQWGLFFYSPSDTGDRIIYVPVALAGFIFVIATIWDAITDPVVGWWSDKVPPLPGRFRFPRIRGRRRPFIFWGSIGLTITSVAIMYPPVDGTSTLNFLYGTVMLCLHWLMVTAAMVPLIALGPEIARSEQARVRLGVWAGLGLLLGLTIAAAVTGALLEIFDTAPDGAPTSAEAYRKVAMLYAVIALICYQIPVWCVRERYTEDDARPKLPIREGVAILLRNRPFLHYFFAFFLFSAGFLATQRVLPYWAELGLGGSEETVTQLLLPFLVVALASYAVIPFVARRLHSKWMMVVAFFVVATGMPFMYAIGVADLDTQTKIYLGGLLFAWSGIGQGIIYVMITPMLGEIIDYDEQFSGQRREALYNGLHGVAWKASMAGSVLLATQSMNFWGNSEASPTGVFMVGPLAGLCAFLGLIVMILYPRKRVAAATKAAHREAV
jgi:GPH family glycoside/pentoside/hexuronide:cation symporter